MSNANPEPTETTGTEKATKGVEQDAESDPSLDDGKSADWASEGGATEDGPATDPEADDR